MVISRPSDRVVARLTPFGWIEYRGTRSTAATYTVANGLLPIDLELQHEPANGKARTNHGVRAPCSRYQTLIHRNGCTARHSNPLPACLASHGVVSFGTMRRCRAAGCSCGLWTRIEPNKSNPQAAADGAVAGMAPARRRVPLCHTATDSGVQDRPLCHAGTTN